MQTREASEFTCDFTIVWEQLYPCLLYILCAMHRLWRLRDLRMCKHMQWSWLLRIVAAACTCVRTCVCVPRLRRAKFKCDNWEQFNANTEMLCAGDFCASKLIFSKVSLLGDLEAFNWKYFSDYIFIQIQNMHASARCRGKKWKNI